jgi:hypothetical protein
MTHSESEPSSEPLAERDRRRNPRFRADAAVRVSSAGESIAGRLKDICRDAFLMEGERSFGRGTAVSVALHLPDGGEPLAFEGQVVRLGPSLEGVMAVAFNGLGAEARSRLDAFLARLAS